MPVHDAYARRTPFELVFGERGRADDLVAAVEEEALAQGHDPSDPGAFALMRSVGDYLRELHGAEARPEVIHDGATLLFHLVHFAQAGRPLYVISTALARALVEDRARMPHDPPQPAGYLQLPQHLFWAEAGSDSPESVDGLFWTLVEGRVHTLVVAGLRPDRPGLSVVPLPGAPLSDAPAWLDVVVREKGSDFETDLPGGELDALYGLRATGEALKLLARFFAHVGGSEQPAPQRASDVAGEGPPPSDLPFRRVDLDA